MNSIVVSIKNSNIEGIGVFTVYKTPKDQFLTTVIESDGKITYIGSKINHSWNPNTRIVHDLTSNKYHLVSNKELLPNEELTADYTFTPNFIMKPNINWK
jgi:SET domain-containing protein